MTFYTNTQDFWWYSLCSVMQDVYCQRSPSNSWILLLSGETWAPVEPRSLDSNTPKLQVLRGATVKAPYEQGPFRIPINGPPLALGFVVVVGVVTAALLLTFFIIITETRLYIYCIHEEFWTRLYVYIYVYMYTYIFRIYKEF